MKTALKTQIYDVVHKGKVAKNGKLISKKCTKCLQYLDATEFAVQKEGKIGFTARCKRCTRDVRYKKKFGVGVDFFEFRLTEQNNKCDICQKEFKGPGYGKKLSVKEKPVLDHDHATNIPRGVLCIKCNTALGVVDGNFQWLIEAVKYLRRHGEFGESFHTWKKVFAESQPD